MRRVIKFGGTSIKTGEQMRAMASKIKKLKEAGDQVMYGKFAGTEIKVEDTEYIIMKETELLARL